MHSNDEFNTAIYGYSDRMRGIESTRDLLLINPEETLRARLSEGRTVSLVSDAADGVEWQVDGLKCHALLAAGRMRRRLLSGDESAGPALESGPAIEDACRQVGSGANPGAAD
jgi:hypothetical protein